MFCCLALTTEILDEFRASFDENPKNQLAQNVVTKHDPLESCLRRKTLETTNHVYTHKTDEVKPVTNQRSSGRCWIFACLNAMRIPFVKANNLEDFEFSQNYLFFWDKVSWTNAFGLSYKTIKRGEGSDSTLITFFVFL